MVSQGRPILTAVLVFAVAAGVSVCRAGAETLLLATWDDPPSLDAAYSFMGSVGFRTDARLRDHAIGRGSPAGKPHTRGTAGKWGGGLCCKDADNAAGDGNGDGVSKICGGWFPIADNFNVDQGTIEFWFKPNWDPAESEGAHTLFSTGTHVGPGTGGQDVMYISWYWIEGGDGRLQAGWVSRGNKDPKFILLGEHQLGKGEFRRDTWHHLAISWNTTRGRFFVDGVRANRAYEQNLNLRREPEGTEYILGGQDTSIRLYTPGDPANGVYDNFRVSDGMLYDPDQDFAPPADFSVPQPPATRSIDLGDGVTMEMVLVRSGEFKTESAQGGGNETPIRTVKISKPYYIGATEVTQAQWRAVMGSNPSRVKGPRLPVHNISWNQCREFLGKLRAKSGISSFRLPTEAEWVYACRTESQGRRGGGDADARLGDVAWFQGNSGGRPQPAGKKEPNRWGLHDMLGNVREWCHDPYASDDVKLKGVDPVGRGSGAVLGHALRGGAWADTAGDIRSAAPKVSPPQTAVADAGLRCVIARQLSDSPARSTLVKPLHIFAHRGGGRVYAPDNSMPNMEHAMTLGLTGIEIDFRLTKDGQLVLWHDKEIDDRFYRVGGGRPREKLLGLMTLEEVKNLRYKGDVDGRERELRIVPADEAIGGFKEQTNFYLDVKDVPVEPVLALIARHRISERAIVLSFDTEYLRRVRASDPRIVLCYWRFVPDDPQAARKMMEELADIGVEILGSPGLTGAKVALCHEYGISVRPSGGDVGLSDGRRFLLMGVDGLIPDHPTKVLGAVEKLWGGEYLPIKGQTIYQLLKDRK